MQASKLYSRPLVHDSLQLRRSLLILCDCVPQHSTSHVQISKLLPTHPIANAEFTLPIANAEFTLPMQKAQLQPPRDSRASRDRKDTAPRLVKMDRNEALARMDHAL